jgi:hypothetical protein
MTENVNIKTHYLSNILNFHVDCVKYIDYFAKRYGRVRIAGGACEKETRETAQWPAGLQWIWVTRDGIVDFTISFAKGDTM